VAAVCQKAVWRFGGSTPLAHPAADPGAEHRPRRGSSTDGDRVEDDVIAAGTCRGRSRRRTVRRRCVEDPCRGGQSDNEATHHRSGSQSTSRGTDGCVAHDLRECRRHPTWLTNPPNCPRSRIKNVEPLRQRGHGKRPNSEESQQAERECAEKSSIHRTSQAWLRFRVCMVAARFGPVLMLAMDVRSI
jgi:hypothetical protein